MSISGTITKFEVLTVKSEISALADDEKSLSQFISNKHALAAKNDRYVVKFHVKDSRFNTDVTMNAFIPKGLIDNNLIESGTEINYNSEACHLNIIGIDDWFDRAYNISSQIHDKRIKPQN